MAELLLYVDRRKPANVNPVLPRDGDVIVAARIPLITFHRAQLYLRGHSPYPFQLSLLNQWMSISTGDTQMPTAANLTTWRAKALAAGIPASWFQSFPWGTEEKKKFLIITPDVELTAVEARDYVTSEMQTVTDANGVQTTSVVQFRRVFLSWRNVIPVQYQDDILDPEITIEPGTVPPVPKTSFIIRAAQIGPD